MAKQADVNRVLTLDQLAECHGPILHDLDQSVWSMFLHTASQYPSRTAVVSLWQSEAHLGGLIHRNGEANARREKVTKRDSALRWSYGELLSAVVVVAEWLLDQGCTSGQRLVSPSRS